MLTTLKHKIRFFSLLIITVTTYVLSIIFLFVNYNILSSLIWIFILFISFHLLYLDLYKYPLKYLIYILLWASILEIIFLGHWNFSLIIWILTINTSIWLLGSILNWQTDKSTIFSWINYFFAWWYIFTMWITIAYSFISLWLYNKFPLDCTWLSNATNSVIEFVTKPLKLGRWQVEKIQKDKTTFFTSTVGDIINVSKNISLESKIPTDISFVQKIKNRKEELINNTIKDNESLNRWICDFTLSRINEKLQSAKLQVSVIIFIIFLVYPFMRVVFHIMAILWFLLFELLYISHLYKKWKVTKEVEILE